MKTFKLISLHWESLGRIKIIIIAQFLFLLLTFQAILPLYRTDYDFYKISKDSPLKKSIIYYNETVKFDVYRSSRSENKIKNIDKMGKSYFR